MGKKKEKVFFDPQEEEYSKRAATEADKFDNRLFWIIGGVGALSLGYFQATGILRPDILLVSGYSCLLAALLLLLLGLRITSSLNSSWAIYFREQNNSGEENRKQHCKLCKRTSICNIVFSYIPLGIAFFGIAMIVIFMFVSTT